MDQIYYMKEALKEANKAYQIDETPIGAVIVFNNEIIGRGFNQRNLKKNPLAHAEIIAINEAADAIGDWRLEECTMYITLEPCPMCAGAIVQARIPKIYYGAPNYKSGSAGTIINILGVESFNHQVTVLGGILEVECSNLMKDFFKGLREKKKNQENNS